MAIMIFLISSVLSLKVPFTLWHKDLPSNARDVGLIPGQGTKILHAWEQLSPHTVTRESMSHNERFHIMQ